MSNLPSELLVDLRLGVRKSSACLGFGRLRLGATRSSSSSLFRGDTYMIGSETGQWP